MDALTLITTAHRSLRRTPLRSGLTALGVIIGVAAVITMVSLGSGAKARIEEAFTSVDWSRITVIAQAPENQWQDGVPPKLRRGMGLTLEDYRAIRTEIRGIALASPFAFLSSSQAKANGRHIEPSINGWDVDGLELNERRMLRGAPFGGTDVRRATAVCLISQHVAETLFPDGDALGRPLLLNGVPFVVIGIVDDDWMHQNPYRPQKDVSVLVPITSLLRRLDPDAQISMSLQAERPELVDGIKREVNNLMQRRLGKRKLELRMYQATDGQRQLAEGSRTMTLLLAAIASISLVVGGIGIMNTMLVNVAERTREIGIRRAVGTRDRDVMRQFLAEAVVLSVLGGLIGVALGTAAARVLTYLNDWPTRVTPGSILLAFLCSAGVGIFFGYYPARQASRLDPIQALRTE